jgi:hypothetical protein
MSHLALLSAPLLALLGGAGAAAGGGLAPVHSWETLPVYLHSSNRSGFWNDTALAILARYPMVVIEKWHCQGGESSQPYSPPAGEPCARLTQEERMIQQCAVIKRHSPRLSCIFYMNAAIDFEWYKLHETLVRHEDEGYLPDWALRYENKSFVELTSRETFNFANRSMALEFAATCARAVETGAVDGGAANPTTQGVLGSHGTHSHPIEDRMDPLHNPDRGIFAIGNAHTLVPGPVARL